ncbi:MAG: D-alanyl-D-alanine carboxypeptidase [Clostridiales bacterium]|nr:D-alanyl-D-alanine carboxypeptidase [Clostridiales bacterium]
MKLHERMIYGLMIVILIVSCLCIAEHYAIPMEKDLSMETASYKNVNCGMIVTELFSGRVLSENNADEIMEMASTTKILTAYLAIRTQDLQKNVKITKEMCGIEGSSIYLKEGEVWTLEQLLYGVILRSGNDAATAVAIATAGSVKNFVAQMNEFASELGLKHTNFSNPHGLHDKNHYTTARELAIITMHAMKNPVFAKIAETKSISFVRPDGVSVSFGNKNKLLNTFEGACGVKTGYTKDAGRCLVSAAKRNGMTLIGVVLNVSNMWEQSKSMLELGFQNYALYALLGPEKLFPFTFQGYSLYAGSVRPVFYPLTKDEFSNLKYEVNWTFANEKHLNLKKPVGEVAVFVQNRLLFSKKIYTILHVDGISLGNNKERLYENQQIFGGERRN